MAIKVLFLFSYLLFLGCEAKQVQIGSEVFDTYCLETSDGQSSMTMTDVNHDGHMDLVVVNESHNEVVVFEGDGTGALNKASRTEAGENPTSVDAGDINGDGYIDLVIANHETAYITLLLGDGKGKFKPASNSPYTIPVEPHPHFIRVADMDQDGSLDLVVDHRGAGGLLMLKGLGDGDFASPPQLIQGGGDPYRGFTLEDLNGDQRPDFVTPNPREVGITLSSGTTGLAFASPTTLPSHSPFAVGVSDMNGDGEADIIAASVEGRDPVQVFLAQNGTYIQDNKPLRFSMASGAKQIITGDINGDQYGDVIVSSWNSDVLVLLGAENEFVMTHLEATDAPWGMAIGDLNNDGNDDFVIGDGETERIKVYLTTRD
ncbi:MAG: VCBS repeat-containing protein [Rhodothermaceae bacterium]|nr:VCBS repeat-containing protein [Rhodothermaceae bacterium]